MQPWLEPGDFHSGEILYRKLEGCLAEALARGWLGPKTVVVFPEYIGTWLVTAGEKRAVHSCARLAPAVGLMAASNIIAFLPRVLVSRERDRVAAAVFRMKACRMANDYTAVFGGLARRFELTVVAGSIVLPSPHVADGRVQAGRGPLYNCSAVFRPDGRAEECLVVKAFPTAIEASFTSAGDVRELPVFHTPAGCLGVLICADAWYPDAYSVLRSKGADLMAAPAHIVGDNALAGNWQGYSGGKAPADVDPADVNRISLGEAWRKYATAERSVQAGFRAAVTSHLRGRFWDLGSDGGTVAMLDGQVHEHESDGRGALVNVWL